MSASKFNPIKFVDQLMSDGKRRSERHIVKALSGEHKKRVQHIAEEAIKLLGLPENSILFTVAEQPLQEQARQDFKAWVAARNTNEDQGLRFDERGPWNGKTDRWGTPTRYGYWRVEQDPEKITPGDPPDRLPTREEATRAAKTEAAEFEASEKAKWAKRAGVIEN
jgi:hypothetical protein